MVVHIPLLLFAALLLWFPRSWMRLGVTVLKRHRRPEHKMASEEPWRTREPGDPRLDLRTEFGKFRNYLDLLRAGAGSLALAGGMSIPPGVTVVAGASRADVWQAFTLRALVLLAGLLVQTIRYERGRLRFYPPVFYLAGVSVGLCDIRGAAFAFALVWTCNPMFGNAQGFLTLYAVFMVGFGYLFAGGGNLSAALAGLLAFLPVVLSLLTNKPLTVLARKGTRAPGSG